jgi:uncharacterized protein
VTGLEQLVVLAAGFLGGALTSSVGVASLASFPILIALGVPPVTANVSNTVGLTPAGLSGSFGFRSELREHRGVAVVILVTGLIGSVLGAVLLLALPAGVFESVVPYLILFTCLLVGVQPAITKVLRRGKEEAAPRTRMSPITTFFATLVGIYGGYFGAGAGVMMVAVLGFGTDLELRIVNAMKTLAILSGKIVAAGIFAVVADVDWAIAGLLALGSIIGGYAGARISRHLPPVLLRGLIVVAGIVAAILML